MHIRLEVHLRPCGLGGSAHDGKLLRDVISCNGHKLTVPHGKYLLWDPVYLTTHVATWTEYCKGKDIHLKSMLHKAFDLYDAFFHVFDDNYSPGQGGVADGDTTETEERTHPVKFVGCKYDPRRGYAGNTRKRRQRGSSSDNFVEVLNRVDVAMENMTGTFAERNKHPTTVANKELVGECIRELVELGLLEKYESVVTTMIASCPRCERTFMLTRKEKMVQYMMGLLEKEGLFE